MSYDTLGLLCQKQAVIVNVLLFYTLPSTISQCKFISVHFKMARNVAASKFNCFEVVRVCLVVCSLAL